MGDWDGRNPDGAADAGESDGALDDAGDDAGPPAAACEADPPVPGEAPLRRLTAVEYANTVRDIFGGQVTLPALSLVVDPTEGYATDVARQPITALHIERFAETAQDIAVEVAANRAWAPCDGAVDPGACLHQIVDLLGPRAYRRPLLDDERATMIQLVDDARGEYGFDTALEILVEGLLESPYFLYRPELGGPPDGELEDAVPLTSHEMATRLSYLLWQTMPDDELMSVADADALRTEAQVEAQVRRMLDDERARDAVATFHRQWLSLSKLDELELDALVFPELTPELGPALRRSTEAFLEHAFWEGGTFESLMTSDLVHVDATTAPLLGVDAPAGDQLVPIFLPATERAGLLTQPGLLASTSHGGSHSPVFRGVLTLERVLCQKPKDPPPGIFDDIEPPEDVEINTTRDYHEKVHSGESCVGCHSVIDGVGFLFENYDGLGRFRTEENGYPVDASGQLVGTDVDGPLTGAVQLGQALADSRSARSCLARQWYQFALGRGYTSQDACEVDTLVSHLESADDQLEEMLVGLATSIAFRYRPAPQGSP